MGRRHAKHEPPWRQRRLIARRKASRRGLPSLLVVCEGEQTEPNYLNGFCDARRINRANVTIVPGEKDTDALRLVRKARLRFERDREFDAVYVVCDCAGEDLTQAAELAARPMRNNSGDRIEVQLIVSRPSFEFWLLLHFEYSARPFRDASEVIDVLRRHVTDYEKSDRQIFAKVASGLDLALARSAQLRADLRSADAESPNTDMARLVEALDNLRRQI